MSDFKAKMHQNRFWLGLGPRPRWGNLQRSSRPPSWNKEDLLLREGKECSNGKRRRGRGRQGSREMKGRGWEGKRVEGTPVCIVKFSL